MTLWQSSSSEYTGKRNFVFDSSDFWINFTYSASRVHNLQKKLLIFSHIDMVSSWHDPVETLNSILRFTLTTLSIEFQGSSAGRTGLRWIFNFQNSFSTFSINRINLKSRKLLLLYNCAMHLCAHYLIENVNIEVNITKFIRDSIYGFNIKFQFTQTFSLIANILFRIFKLFVVVYYKLEHWDTYIHVIM